ncbi:MAG: DUF5060 domain-containing protein, partial [Bacillota bacterium]|nr:DUF5060 domain-containing protein [Bacillota bacterium]
MMTRSTYTMQSIAKWEIFEQQLTSEQAFVNPFLDVDLQAVLTCGRQQHCVDGFYDGLQDGRHIWRFRFAPMQEGNWQYETRSNVAEFDGRTGSFQCGEPLSAGGLTTNPHFANWFFREDGSPQWIVNDGWYPHPANGGDFDYEEVNFPQPSEQDMIDYIRILSGYGVNMVIDIAQLYARQSHITDPTFRWPWAVVDAKNNKIDKDRFNLPYYQRMDRVMQAAKQYGLFFAMELLYDNSVVRPREWSHHPLNVQNRGWLEGNEHGTGWDRMFDLDNPV